MPVANTTIVEATTMGAVSRISGSGGPLDRYAEFRVNSGKIDTVLAILIEIAETSPRNR